MFAITAEQFIAEYEDVAEFHRDDYPQHPPDFWPPWTELAPERQEQLIQQTAQAMKELIHSRSWNLLEEALYRGVNFPDGLPGLPRVYPPFREPFPPTSNTENPAAAAGNSGPEAEC